MMRSASPWTPARANGPPAFDCTVFLRSSSFDFLVALERHPFDRWIFDDLDQNAIPVPGNGHVLEHPGRVKALERRVERARIESPVGAGVKMRTDHRRVDVPVAGDGDRGLRLAGRERARAGGGGKKQRKQYDQH